MDNNKKRKHDDANNNEQKKKKWKDDLKEHEERCKEPTTPHMCPICYNAMHEMNIVQLNSCSHKYCKSCIKKWSKQQNTCPECRKPFSQFYMYDTNFQLVTVDIDKGNAKKKLVGFTMNHVYDLVSIVKEHTKERKPYLDLLVKIQARFDDDPFNILDLGLRTQLIYWDVRLSLLTPYILDRSISPFMFSIDQTYSSDCRINIVIYWGFNKGFRDKVMEILLDNGENYYHHQRSKAYMIYNIIERFYMYNNVPFDLNPEKGGLHEWFMMATNIVKNSPFPHPPIADVGIYRCKIKHVIRVRGMLLGTPEDDILKEVIHCVRQPNERNGKYLQRLPRI